MAARKDRLFYIKLGISLSLIGYVFSKVGWTEFVDTLRKADPLFVFLNFAISPVMTLVSVMKWRVLLRAKAVNVSLWRLFILYLLGKFFNNLLPSNVGGDVVRGYALGKETGRLEDVLASVFLERMTGFTVLLLLVLLVIAANLQFLEDIKVSVAVGGAVVGYFAVLWVVYDSRPLAFCGPRLRLGFLSKIFVKIQKLQMAIQAYQDHSGVWVPVMALSALFYLLAIVNVYLGCLAFSTQVPFSVLLTAVPIILTISLAPISLGSVGLQEWGYFIVFEHLGVPGALGLSVALLIRAKEIIISGIGGLFYARRLTRNEARGESPHENLDSEL